MCYLVGDARRAIRFCTVRADRRIWVCNLPARRNRDDELGTWRSPASQTTDCTNLWRVQSQTTEERSLHCFILKYLGLLVLIILNNLVFSGKVGYGSVIMRWSDHFTTMLLSRFTGVEYYKPACAINGSVVVTIEVDRWSQIDRQAYSRASLVDTACDAYSALITNKHTHARTTSAHSHLSAVCPDRWREEDALLYERV